MAVSEIWKSGQLLGLGGVDSSVGVLSRPNRTTLGQALALRFVALIPGPLHSGAPLAAPGERVVVGQMREGARPSAVASSAPTTPLTGRFSSDRGAFPAVQRPCLVLENRQSFDGFFSSRMPMVLSSR